LIWHYYHSKPVSLTAVGQKKRLAREGIHAYDAVQVRVDYANGMSIHFHNNWITPPDFEGPVNQGHEIVGTDGKVESDQQYRGLRFWHKGGGSRTVNTHFTRDVARPDGSKTCVGYGVDSLNGGPGGDLPAQVLWRKPRPTVSALSDSRGRAPDGGHSSCGGAGARPEFQIHPKTASARP
jgi:hypothetical protein